MDDLQPYLLIHTHTRTGQYFQKLYQHFETDIRAYYNDLPAAADYNTLYHIAVQLSFDADGRFVLRHINSREALPAAILLFIAGAHLLVEEDNRPGLQRLSGYYRLKSATRYRWGNGLSPLFDYLSILLKYAKRTISYKPPAASLPYDARLVHLGGTA